MDFSVAFKSGMVMLLVIILAHVCLTNNQHQTPPPPPPPPDNKNEPDELYRYLFEQHPGEAEAFKAADKTPDAYDSFDMYDQQYSSIKNI